ncbi:MAG: Sulfate/thiosulfate import ATP-binding protein CysA [Pseudomonadota bacterium]|jgi:ABC-type transport system involved in cytochrome c biogenesis ATPase subunit
MTQPKSFSTPAFVLCPGLIAVTGDERSGKTSFLRRISGDLAPLPGEVPPADAVWLDLSLAGHDDQTPDQLWIAMQVRHPRWNDGLLQDLIDALDLSDHRGKKLYMLSTGSRRKVAVAGLLASGATVTCLDQPYAAVDWVSVQVIRDFLTDVAGHATRSWVVADYEADPQLPWRQVISLD